MSVDIKPLPNGFRSVPPRLWCLHPPIFGGAPTREDVEVAIALLEELARVDQLSFQWYGGTFTIARLRQRLADA